MALGKVFFNFVNFGPLQGPNFGRHVFQAGPDQGQSRHVFRVEVARQDLGRNFLWPQAQLLADVLFHEGINFGKGTDRPGNLTGFDPLRGVFEAFLIPLHFRVPAGRLQPKGGWFGVNSVGPPHADGVLVLAGQISHDRHKVRDVLAQEVVSLL